MFEFFDENNNLEPKLIPYFNNNFIDNEIVDLDNLNDFEKFWLKYKSSGLTFR
jgi:hypothetical protein